MRGVARNAISGGLLRAAHTQGPKSREANISSQVSRLLLAAQSQYAKIILHAQSIKVKVFEITGLLTPGVLPSRPLGSAIFNVDLLCIGWVKPGYNRHIYELSLPSRNHALTDIPTKTICTSTSDTRLPQYQLMLCSKLVPLSIVSYSIE